jgi:hypothetical protein
MEDDQRCRKISITEPAEWIDLWRDAAKEEGKTLSEWIGEQCNKALPREVRRELGERPKAGRRW